MAAWSGQTSWGAHGNCSTYIPSLFNLSANVAARLQKGAANAFAGTGGESEALSFNEQGYADGCPHGDGWVPMPHPSGFGWIWAGATPAIYNRFIRQSIDDASTIQGAAGAWEFLNGQAKWLALANGEDPILFTVAHPGVICIVPGWYSGGEWSKSHGGDGSDQRFAVYFRDGATVAAPPQPWHGSSTGFIVVGGLAALAGGIAIVGAAAGGAGGAAGAAASGSSSILTQVATQLPQAVLQTHGDLGSLGQSLLGTAVNGADSMADSDNFDFGFTDNGFSFGDAFDDLASGIKTGVNAYNQVDSVVNQINGSDGSAGPNATAKVVQGNGATPAEALNKNGFLYIALAIAAALLL